MLQQAPVPEVDLVFRALADGSRRSIVDQLSRGPATVSELHEPLDMTLAAVMQHLKVLEACGLVCSEKIGRVRSCRINPAALDVAASWIDHRQRQWERRLDRLGDLLSQPDDERSTP